MFRLLSNFATLALIVSRLLLALALGVEMAVRGVKLRLRATGERPRIWEGSRGWVGSRLWIEVEGGFWRREGGLGFNGTTGELVLIRGLESGIRGGDRRTEEDGERRTEEGGERRGDKEEVTGDKSWGGGRGEGEETTWGGGRLSERLVA